MGRKGERRGSPLSAVALGTLAVAAVVLFILFSRLQSFQEQPAQDRLVQSNNSPTKVVSFLGKQTQQLQDLAALQVAHREQTLKDVGTGSENAGNDGKIGGKHFGKWKPGHHPKKKPGVNHKVIRNNPQKMSKDLKLFFGDVTAKYMKKIKSRKGKARWSRRKRKPRTKTHSTRVEGSSAVDGSVNSGGSGSHVSLNVDPRRERAKKLLLIKKKKIRHGVKKDTKGLLKKLMSRRWTTKGAKGHKKKRHHRKGHTGRKKHHTRHAGHRIGGDVVHQTQTRTEPSSSEE